MDYLTTRGRRRFLVLDRVFDDLRVLCDLLDPLVDFFLRLLLAAINRFPDLNLRDDTDAVRLEDDFDLREEVVFDRLPNSETFH